MNKRFSLIFLFLPSLLVPGCGGGDDGSHSEIVISGLGVNFAPYDGSTGKAGDFIFDKTGPQKVFLEFGADVGTKYLPTFEYQVDKSAQVTAIAEGIVDRVFVNAEGDFEIVVHYTPNQDYFVVYDHITNLNVGVGDRITPGQVLGNPGFWYTIPDLYGRFEIMVNRYSTGLSYCPFVYFDPSLRAEYEQKVTLFMQEWETLQGNTSIYDEANYPYPGCRFESMTSY